MRVLAYPSPGSCSARKGPPLAPARSQGLYDSASVKLAVQTRSGHNKPLPLHARANLAAPHYACNNHGQAATPLLDAVKQRGDIVTDVALHVPGHKRGRGVSPRFQELMDGPNPLRYDLTEIQGLDYLSSPSGVIREAQQLAARAFGADHTWFLVNGCSVGIHAAVMAAAGPGDTLLLARNCHLSAFSAMVLAGCRPWWVAPQYDPRHQLPHCVTPDQLQAAFMEAKQAGARPSAVLLVSPTYFGAAAHLPELAEVCHRHGSTLIVDEAHGGHFAFLPPNGGSGASANNSSSSNSVQSSDPLPGQRQGRQGRAGMHQQQENLSHQSLQPPCYRPMPALAAGADYVVQSSHKVLGALTQAAMLHVQGPRVDADRVARALLTLQTSSPSYLLLSSLDAARAHALEPSCLAEALQAAQVAREGLATLPGISLLGPDPHVPSGPAGSCTSSVSAWDPLRLVVDVGGLGMNGYAAAEALEAGWRIVPELATHQVVVFVMGPGTRLPDAHALVGAFQQLCGGSAGQPQNSRGGITSSSSSESAQASSLVSPAMVLTPRDAFFCRNSRVTINEAVGRVSAELLCPYPPGIPVLYPGEVVTEEAVNSLLSTLGSGGVVTGCVDSSLMTLGVLEVPAA